MNTSQPQLVTRAFSASLDTDGDGRTIMGRCVPYDQPTLVQDDPAGLPYSEVWKHGAFRSALRDPTRVHLVFAHDESAIGNRLGHAVQFTDGDGGLDASFRAIGAPGEQALELIRAGMCRGLSIHAAIPPSGSRMRQDGVVERTMARLLHVALVTEPAYADALVTAIRSGTDAASRPSIAQVRDMQEQLRVRSRQT